MKPDERIAVLEGLAELAAILLLWWWVHFLWTRGPLW